MVGLDTWTWQGSQETRCVSGIWQTVKEKASGYEDLLCPLLETQAPGDLQSGQYAELITRECLGPAPEHALEPWPPGG